MSRIAGPSETEETGMSYGYQSGVFSVTDQDSNVNIERPFDGNYPVDETQIGSLTVSNSSDGDYTISATVSEIQVYDVVAGSWTTVMSDLGGLSFNRTETSSKTLEINESTAFEAMEADSIRAVMTDVSGFADIDLDYDYHALGVPTHGHKL